MMGHTLTSGRNLLASSSNTDDDTLAPTLVAGFQGGAHNTDVTGAVEGVVATTIGHLNELFLDSLAVEFGGVDKVGGTELASPRLLAVVDIDSNDLARLVLDSTLDDGETNTASTEDSHVRALLDLGSDNGRTVAGGDTTTEQAGPVSRDLGCDSDNGDISNNGVLGEGGSAHEVQQVLATGLEP